MAVQPFGGEASSPPATWPLSKGPGKQSISLVFTAESFYFGTRQEIWLKTIQVLDRVVAKAYKESGLFSDVKIGAAETDLRAEVHVLRRAQKQTASSWRISHFLRSL